MTTDAWAGRIFRNGASLSIEPDRQPVGMRWYSATPFRVVPPRAVVIHPDWDRPLPPAPVALMEAMRRKLEAAIEAEIRRMLGL